VAPRLIKPTGCAGYGANVFAAATGDGCGLGGGFGTRTFKVGSPFAATLGGCVADDLDDLSGTAAGTPDSVSSDNAVDTALNTKSPTLPIAALAFLLDIGASDGGCGGIDGSAVADFAAAESVNSARTPLNANAFEFLCPCDLLRGNFGSAI
jgi:hypothetical protein